MRITVLAYGSRGDVQPYLALAYALKMAGHWVQIVANVNFRSLITSYDVPFRPISIDSKALASQVTTQKWLNSRSIVSLALRSPRVVRPELPRLINELMAHSKDAQVLVYHSYTLPMGYYLGKALGITAIPASIYPLPTVCHPALPLNVKRELGPQFNLLSHKIVDQFTWLTYRKATQRFFGRSLRVDWRSPYRHLRAEGTPILCCYSKIALPEPTDLPGNARICGYWHLPPPPGWQPPPGLEHFLSAGPPPVHVGFGSMGDPRSAEQTSLLIKEALRLADCRAVVTSGWSGLGQGIRSSRRFMAVGQVPHDWLLPQMAATIHHGGVGTTGAGLSAGIPNVVIPHFADQYFWGKRVKDLGAGPSPIPRRNLSSKDLSEALCNTLEDMNIRRSATEIGRRLSQEDGLTVAVNEIERHLAKG